MQINSNIVVYAIVICIIVFFLFVSWSARASVRQSIATLAKSKCPFCDEIYGMLVASAAHAQFVRSCREARNGSPHVRINLGHNWPVKCPECDKETEFDSYKNQIAVSIQLSLHTLSGEAWEPTAQPLALEND